MDTTQSESKGARVPEVGKMVHLGSLCLPITEIKDGTAFVKDWNQMLEFPLDALVWGEEYHAYELTEVYRQASAEAEEMKSRARIPTAGDSVHLCHCCLTIEEITGGIAIVIEPPLRFEIPISSLEYSRDCGCFKVTGSDAKVIDNSTNPPTVKPYK